MTSQLHALHETGDEYLAVLWASEPQIYGRFGYGMATRGVSMTVPRDPQALHVDAPHDPAVRLRLVPPEKWELTADVYDRVRRTRAGSLARDERWWRRAVRDLASMRDGKSELRCVVAEDDKDIRGFARYATKQNWGDSGDNEVAVREVYASDAAALAALYRYLFDLDLMDKVSIWNSPVDDPLLHWLRNPRLAKPSLFDALYVRLVDLDRALAARTYATEVDVVLAVTDDRCPWNAGRWRLVGGPDGATCSPSTDEAALALDVRELGAAYLGGTSLAELAMAGRVTELRPGTLAAASGAFLTTPAPWCPVVF
jgi:predicted acetyltransferase